MVGIHSTIVGYTLNMVEDTLNRSGIYTQPWWDIHSTIVAYTLNHGGIYNQPWWDIHSTMVGYSFEDKSLTSL